MVSAIGKQRVFLKVGDGSTALNFANISIANWCMVSNGTIHFPTAFTEKGGSGEVTHIIIREKKGSGSLIKANLLIMFFKNSDITTAPGNAFVWTAGTTVLDLIGKVEIETTDYVDIKNNGTADASIAIVALNPVLPLKMTEDWQDILAVIVSLETNAITYPTDGDFDMELIVNQD